LRAQQAAQRKQSIAQNFVFGKLNVTFQKAVWKVARLHFSKLFRK